MNKLIPALLAAFIATPATAEYYDIPAQNEAGDCALFLLYNSPDAPGPEDITFDQWINDSNDAAWCGRIVLDWVFDTGRATPVPGPWTDADFVTALCGARIILRHSDKPTPIADILAAEFDQGCSENAIM